MASGDPQPAVVVATRLDFAQGSRSRSPNRVGSTERRPYKDRSGVSALCGFRPKERAAAPERELSGINPEESRAYRGLEGEGPWRCGLTAG